jgi:DNA-binding beta-propeller fold protein YncE
MALLAVAVAAVGLATACTGSGPASDRVTVRFDGTPPLAASGRPPGLSPTSVAVHGGTVWVADPGTEQVVGVDASSHQVRTVVPIAGFPSLVAAGASGAWAATRLTGWVAPLDQAEAVDEVGAQLGDLRPPDAVSSGGDFPEALAIDTNGSGAVWVTNFAGRSLSRVDPGQPSDTASVVVDLGFRPSGVAVVGGEPWVAGITHGAVVRLNADGSFLGETQVAGGPEWLATGSDSVFVTARLAGRLERLDARSGAVTGGVDLGFRPGAVEVADRGTWPGGTGAVVWVADPVGGSVVGLDPSSLEVLVSFDVGGVPVSLAASDATLWVADAGRGAVVSIDTATGDARFVPMPASGAGERIPVGSDPSPEVMGSVSGVMPVADPAGQASGSVAVRVPLDLEPFYVAADASGVWVADAFGNDLGRSKVAVVDPVSLEILGVATIGGALGGVALEPSGAHAWVSGFERGQVARFPTAAPGSGPDQVVEVGSNPLGLVATAESLWVPLRGDGRVVRLDTQGDTRQVAIEVGEGPANIAVDPETGNLWVTLADVQALAEVDPGTNTVVRVVPVGNTPVGIAVGAGSVWVTTRDDGALVVVDPVAGVVVERILVGNRPRGVVVIDGGGPGGDGGPATVWVAVSGDGTLVRLDAATRRVEGLVPVGVFPINLAVADGPGEVEVWVTDLDGRALLGVSPGE